MGNPLLVGPGVCGDGEPPALVLPGFGAAKIPNQPPLGTCTQVGMSHGPVCPWCWDDAPMGLRHPGVCSRAKPNVLC